MISGDSFSRVSVTHPREGGHSQAARSKSAHAGPDESLHSGPYSCDAQIFSFGSPEQPVKNFALTVHMGFVLGGQDERPLEAPISYAWAYRDFPDNALVALLVIRHACRF
ncbi:hypothetical protein CDL15_Pgr012477 [Punica granatum]|uniref:Uncharacterized protein n=1 Tax=Punica granatum TaxID=22663 RepID=A0A218WY18_PUNGR|nr:hypothetical protein CDL15_Pgr012477 [Punica granatum]PKI52261.1 hypothetical protein CRG98_027359 [Punica granatum]